MDVKKDSYKVKDISAKQAKELIDNEKDVIVVDVRTKEKYNEVHIKGANLIPVQELEQNIHKIPKDKKVIIHCGSRNSSSKACEILKGKGLKNLYHLKGGIREWQAEGYQVEKI